MCTDFLWKTAVRLHRVLPKSLESSVGNILKTFLEHAAAKMSLSETQMNFWNWKFILTFLVDVWFNLDDVRVDFEGWVWKVISSVWSVQWDVWMCTHMYTYGSMPLWFSLQIWTVRGTECANVQLWHSLCMSTYVRSDGLTLGIM